MIVEYIRYRIPEGQDEAFVAAYARAQRPLAASPHCLTYELTRCAEEPERFVLRIEWDSLDGHLQGFRRSEEFRAFLREVGPFVGMIEEMQHYELTDVRSTPAA
jgi:quinol monooxygenase YgiN